jgi:aspartate/methionine/tyrosine aminotransferase
MANANPQAIELNEIILKHSKATSELLSGRGKGIFFPKKGILAQAKDAKTKKINATIGMALEEDGTPMRLKCLAKLIKKLNPKDIFPQAPSFGKPEIRKKWQEMIKSKNPSLNSETSLPIVTSALTHGLSILGYLFLTPGDKIISPDLFWGNYKLIFQNTYGAKIDTFETFKESKFNLGGLKEKLNAKDSNKKVILLNFPNNPTGYTPTDGEVKQIVEIIKESAENGNNILVMIDDAYFGLVYKEGIYKESIFSKLANLHKNVLAVKIDGATKEDYVWGLRVGFITYATKDGAKEFYEALEAKTAGAVRGTISNASHLSQSLMLKTYEARRYSKEKQKKYNLLKARYEEVKETLKEEKYKEHFTPLPYNSGYFMCVKLKSKDGEEIRQILLEKYDTGVIAMGNVLRIAYSAMPKNQIKELFENIYNACSNKTDNSNEDPLDSNKPKDDDGFVELKEVKKWKQ